MPPVLGEVATRIGVPGGSIYGGPGIMARSWHYLREDVTALRIGFANWYAGNSGSVSSGASMTVRASVEAPGGTLTQGALAGNPAVVGASGATIFLDVPYTGAAGSKFYVRALYSGTAIPYGIPTRTRPLDLAAGDAVEFANTDKTMSGTVTDSGAGVMIFPVSCLGLTSKGWINVLGDSIGVGSSDIEIDSTGDCGVVERPFGGQYAYSNLSCAGETGNAFVTGGQHRVALIQPGATVICEYGTNDLNGVTATTLRATIAALRALLPVGIRFYTMTMPPVVTSSDGVTTLVGQTPNSYTTERLASNVIRLANADGYDGCFDVASVFADAGDPTRWKVNATPYKYVKNDGVPTLIHPTSYADRLLSFTLDPIPVPPDPTPGLPKFQMQGRNASQQIVTWLADSPDWAGAGAPVSVTDVVVYQRSRGRA